MKIASYVPVNGKIEGIKIFRPTQTILIVLKKAGGLLPSVLSLLEGKINVTRQNSLNGSQDTIIPFVSLSNLAQIATMNEGAILFESGTTATLPIMLSVKGNVPLDNDKYLEIDLVDLTNVTGVDIYAYSVDKMSDFITKYSKFAAPAGVARHITTVKQNDILCMPLTGFDSIQLVYQNGVVATMTPQELKYDMCRNNDITSYMTIDNHTVYSNILLDGDNEPNGACTELVMGYASCYIKSLLGVESLEIIRDSNCIAPFEFILADLTI